MNLDILGYLRRSVGLFRNRGYLKLLLVLWVLPLAMIIASACTLLWNLGALHEQLDAKLHITRRPRGLFELVFDKSDVKHHFSTEGFRVTSDELSYASSTSDTTFRYPTIRAVLAEPVLIGLPLLLLVFSGIALLLGVLTYIAFVIVDVYGVERGQRWSRSAIWRP